jgi:hypothetical protein
VEVTDAVPMAGRLNAEGLEGAQFDQAARTERQGLAFAGIRPSPMEWPALRRALMACIQRYNDIYSDIDLPVEVCAPGAPADQVAVWKHTAALIHFTRRLNSTSYTREWSKQSCYLKVRFNLGQGRSTRVATFIAVARYYVRARRQNGVSATSTVPSCLAHEFMRLTSKSFACRIGLGLLCATFSTRPCG